MLTPSDISKRLADRAADVARHLLPGGKKKITTSSDTEPCLFGWQAIPDGIREVTITEGEIDAMTAWQYGRPALSVPFGGGK
ncbi:putative replication helicase, partial [Pseudomonas phage vB_Pae_CF67a]